MIRRLVEIADRMLPVASRRRLLVIYWLALAIGSHIPNLRLGQGRFVSPDQAMHIAAYAVLPLLLITARLFPGRWPGVFMRGNIIAGAGIAFFWGLLTEVSQEFFVPGRQATLKDVASNAIGIGIAVLVMAVIATRGPSNATPPTEPSASSS